MRKLIVPVLLMVALPVFAATPLTYEEADTDGDGLPDGYEVMTLGTDPLKADSDDNGTTDGQEDADSDTLNNLREYQLGTDPNKAENHFTSRYGKSHLLRTQKARLVFRRNETESLDCAGTLK